MNKIKKLFLFIFTSIFSTLSFESPGTLCWPVIDATGNLKTIKNAFQYMVHGARYVLIGLQNGDVCFSHPEFHKREATLMSSRNATREDG